MYRRWMAGLVLAFAATPGLATPPNVILGAEYTKPTDRYGHGVLGPDAEWGALHLTVDFCLGCEGADIRDVMIRLPSSRVFEDIAPRLIDLDFDDIPEVVVIESDSDLGSRLAIYGDAGLITATPFIGHSYRWLAPLGAADLDGDRAMELAYIDRPHLAKTLRVWRYKDAELTEIAAAPGLTNHRIGEEFISGGIRDCGDGPEIITADASWRKVVATRLENDALISREIGDFQSPASLSDALSCE